MLEGGGYTIKRTDIVGGVRVYNKKDRYCWKGEGIVKRGHIFGEERDGV